MGSLDKVPKSFLLGIALASMICVVGLVIHITVLGGQRETRGKGNY